MVALCRLGDFLILPLIGTGRLVFNKVIVRTASDDHPNELLILPGI